MLPLKSEVQIYIWKAKEKNFNSNLKLFLLTFGVNEVLMIMINKNEHKSGFS